MKEEADDVAATPLPSNHKPDPPSAAPPNHAGGTVADLPAAAAPPSAFKISVVGSCDTRPEKQEGPPAQAEAGTTTVEPKEGAGSTLQDESGCEADADGLPRAGLRAPLEKLRKAGLGAPLVSAKRVLRTHNSDEGDLELVYTNVDAIQVCFSLPLLARVKGAFVCTGWSLFCVKAVHRPVPFSLLIGLAPSLYVRSWSLSGGV